MTYAEIETPAFLMCEPFAWHTDIANNVWMEEDHQKGDRDVAFAQWSDLYGLVSAESLVPLLPHDHSREDLGDLTFVANLGVVIGDTFIASNFTAEGRHAETKIGLEFFKQAGYEVRKLQPRFEGDADLKHLHDNVWAGGYGIRTDAQALNMISGLCDIEIVPLKLTDPRAYHLDCSLFPLTSTDTLVCTELFEEQEVKALANVTNIIDVPLDEALMGATNNVRVQGTILNASNIHDLDRHSEDYEAELEKNRFLEDVCREFDFNLGFVNLSEFLKSGALLSCLLLHLNRQSYAY